MSQRECYSAFHYQSNFWTVCKNFKIFFSTKLSSICSTVRTYVIPIYISYSSFDLLLNLIWIHASIYWKKQKASPNLFRGCGKICDIPNRTVFHCTSHWTWLRIWQKISSQMVIWKYMLRTYGTQSSPEKLYAHMYVNVMCVSVIHCCLIKSQ